MGDDQQLTTEQSGEAPMLEYRRVEAGGSLSREDVALLACRLLAAYCGLRSLSLFGILAYIPYGLSATGGLMPWVTILASGLPSAVSLALAILLWTKSRTFARLLLPSVDSVAAPLASRRGTEVQAIAFSIVGIYLVVRGVPSLVQCIGQELWGGEPLLNVLDATRFIEPIVIILLGTALFLGGRGLARVWRRLRK